MTTGPAPLSRRTAVGGLVAVTAAVASGCTTDRPPAPPQSPSPSVITPPPDPDVALAAAVLRDEQAMLDRVVATVRSHPTLASTVGGARAAHRAHVALLTRAVPSGTAGRPARHRRHRVPDGAAAALTALARAEEHLAATGRRSALAADSGPFARVLASMAAAASQQAVLVTRAAESRGGNRG